VYYWPYWSNGRWENGDLGGIGGDGYTYDRYLNGTLFQDDELANPAGKKNVKGAASCSSNDCWFEYAKALRSGDGYDWNLNPGEVVCRRPPDLLVQIWFGNWDLDLHYRRYVILYLSSEIEDSPDHIKSSFSWQSGKAFSWGEFLLSPDFVVDAGAGTYEVEKVDIDATITKLVPDYYAFDVGVTVGSKPELFQVVCDKYCGRISSNRYYGVGTTLAPLARGNQQIRLTIDFLQMGFSVETSNSSEQPTLIFKSDDLQYDSSFVTDGRVYVNLVLWTGHYEQRAADLVLQNATMSIEIVREPRLSAMLPKPSLERPWIWNVSRHGLSTPVAGSAVSDDGHILVAVNAYNRTWESAEVYQLDSEGQVEWSRKYPESQFYWNLLNVALTPDGKFAAYAIFSSANSSNAGIWCVDANGNPVWVHHEDWYHSVAMSSDGKLVAAVRSGNLTGNKIEADGNLLVFDERGQVLWQHRFPDELAMKVAVSPDGEFVAVTTGVQGPKHGTNSGVHLFDKNGSVLWRHVGSAIARSVDLSSTAMKILVTYSDGTVELLDRSGAVSARYLHSYRYAFMGEWVQGGDTWSGAITDDGSQSLTSQGFSLFIFGPDLISLIAVPSIPESVTSVAVSSGGKFVAAGTYAGVLFSYILSSERPVEYASRLNQAAEDLGVSTGAAALAEVIRLESEGRWLDAYLQSEQLVNATIAALRGEYSRSHVEAQAIMSRSLGFLNVTTSRLEGSKLNSTQYSKATDLLSEARQSLNLAQQYLDKAPDEFRSGNYPIAVRLVHNALRAIQEAQARIGDADMLISESVSTSGKIPSIQDLTTEGAFMLVVFVVISSVIIAVLVKRRRGLIPSPGNQERILPLTR